MAPKTKEKSMNRKSCLMPSTAAAEQIVAGERGIALFSTGLVRRGFCVTARAT
jgi:hypothetical protein